VWTQPRGFAVTFPGSARHAGVAIRSGVRYVLVGFSHHHNHGAAGCTTGDEPCLSSLGGSLGDGGYGPGPDQLENVVFGRPYNVTMHPPVAAPHLDNGSVAIEVAWWTCQQPSDPGWSDPGIRIRTQSKLGSDRPAPPPTAGSVPRQLHQPELPKLSAGGVATLSASGGAALTTIRNRSQPAPGRMAAAADDGAANLLGLVWFVRSAIQRPVRHGATVKGERVAVPEPVSGICGGDEGAVGGGSHAKRPPWAPIRRVESLSIPLPGSTFEGKRRDIASIKLFSPLV
jgi:hypothetical protein